MPAGWTLGKVLAFSAAAEKCPVLTAANIGLTQVASHHVLCFMVQAKLIFSLKVHEPGAVFELTSCTSNSAHLKTLVTL